MLPKCYNIHQITLITIDGLNQSMKNLQSHIHGLLYPAFKAELDKEPRASGICEITGEWQENGYQITDSYKQTYVQSELVRLFTLPSKNNLGLANGNTPQNLIGFKSSWVVIPLDDGKPELWIGGKYVAKVPETTCFLIKDLTGNAALIALLEDERPLITIDCNIRKELWFRNLQGGSKNHLAVVAETGLVIIPKTGWPDFKNAYLQLDKKARQDGLVILRSIADGRMDQSSERVQTFYEQNPEFIEVCAKSLPKNPHARLFWLSALGAV